MKRYVLIVAGGKGLRMGGDLPKQFIPIEGKPILMHTLEVFHRWDNSARLVLVLPEDHQPYWKMLCREIGCSVPHVIVNGGDTRFQSVRNGLEFLSKEMEISSERNKKALVAVHDGVRPFVSKEVITACFEKAEQTGCAVPVVAMIDSLREIDENGSHPVDRSHYLAVQTPQVFCSDILLRAYEQPFSSLFTDDASVVEAMGETIHTVSGNRENIKITTPFDLLIAQALFTQHV
ncbi:2-C-methyl-D-erythritol 4-phosphate cytidylyltransferase [Parabacteroides bouchesdurhonensis]|uniref:2-C-methyl-D-erythritol 4-phosphate cytidylyltransferase n=1 Tax=Parabacteroides bouchesdurhonensis TaxID=1936995 RepID=UPI000E5355CE|nr:2-C-methyl-D-erythritol 4-phosphate cytidylyltransferase [Parabacteroides bouchesdurhonensis]RHJ92941.1 2-C-methyl-D-erythritol 4-phosphate cytidylyltransferase [Bacteroides sp. AM07-16]